MNWCKEHWDYLKEVLAAKGLSRFIGHGAEDALSGMLGVRFDPLMGSWNAINAKMLESPGLNGRILECPLCILARDGQPHLVKNWVDGSTTEAVFYAVEKGLMERPGQVTIPAPPAEFGTLPTREAVTTNAVQAPVSGDVECVETGNGALATNEVETLYDALKKSLEAAKRVESERWACDENKTEGEQ